MRVKRDRNHGTRNHCTGMSLLEIMVALALAGILTMVVLKLNERQLAANKDFVLRNEIEMVRLEVVSLLQKDCRPILQGVQVVPGQPIPEEFFTKLPLMLVKFEKKDEDYQKLVVPDDYQEVERYKDYRTDGHAALSDTAGSLWLQDVRLKFDPASSGAEEAQAILPPNELSEHNHTLKAAVMLDFYRRLSSQHKNPQAGESNLTTVIPLRVVFKKATGDDEMDPATGLKVVDGHYVIEACTCSGEFELSNLELQKI